MLSSRLTFKFSQWILICMTAGTKVNDGEVAGLQVHQDVLILDVPDGEAEYKYIWIDMRVNI